MNTQCLVEGATIDARPILRFAQDRPEGHGNAFPTSLSGDNLLLGFSCAPSSKEAQAHV